jgi:regulator of protease activity HflC (stomatin/prohibitin superfamily)
MVRAGQRQPDTSSPRQIEWHDILAISEKMCHNMPMISRTNTQKPASTVAGPLAVIGAGAVLALGVAGVIAGIGNDDAALTIAGVVALCVFAVLAAGFVAVEPNDSRVLILFGRYTGTVLDPGLWWVNPFTVFWRKSISLRIRNFQSERIKVNDASGNPIEIAAVVVWRLVDTAKAVFDVDNYRQFVTVQSETALRHLAGNYPYDDYGAGRTSLRDGADEVRESLQAELQARLEAAGIEVLETRLTHIAYAPEIAEVMLRRQQAEAILAARKTMVLGAVGLVQAALAQLADTDLVNLDPERKAAMVANLMVVLSGDHSPTPVINTGSLYT